MRVYGSTTASFYTWVFDTSNFKSTHDLSLASVLAILINGRLSFCVFVSDIYY